MFVLTKRDFFRGIRKKSIIINKWNSLSGMCRKLSLSVSVTEELQNGKEIELPAFQQNCIIIIYAQIYEHNFRRIYRYG